MVLGTLKRVDHGEGSMEPLEIRDMWVWEVRKLRAEWMGDADNWITDTGGEDVEGGLNMELSTNRDVEDIVSGLDMVRGTVREC